VAPCQRMRNGTGLLHATYLGGCAECFGAPESPFTGSTGVGFHL
jgi:hypothetical protein